jgi:glycosyltransferase involved in cell wall biosynthesis
MLIIIHLMNIVIITQYHIFDIPGGGASRLLDIYARGLSRVGHKVSIVGQYMNDGKPYMENIDRLYDAYRIKDRGLMLLRMPSIMRIIKKIKPDAIIISHFTYAKNCYFIGRIINCKAISFLHDEVEIYGVKESGNLFEYINRKFTKYMDCIIADTKIVSNILFKETGVKSIVCQVGISLPEHDIKTIYRKYSDGGSPFKFIFIGRLIKDKGVDILVDAFNKYNNKYPNSKCVFVGGGNYLEEFKNKYENNDSMEIKGYLEEMEMLDELVSSDIFVNPTYIKEGIVLTNIQAMKLGVPVISTDTGATSEAIANNINGILVEPKNAEEMFLAMERLSIFPDIAERMAKESLKTSEQFNETESIKRLEGILYNTIKSDKNEDFVY